LGLCRTVTTSRTGGGEPRTFRIFADLAAARTRIEAGEETISHAQLLAEQADQG